MSRRFFVLSGLGLTVAGLRWYTAGGVNLYTPNMDNKLVIVTGGNSGIGKETAKEILRLKGKVIITGRDF